MTIRRAGTLTGEGLPHLIGTSAARVRHRGRVRTAVTGAMTGLLVALSACTADGAPTAAPSVTAGTTAPSLSASGGPGAAQGARIDETTLKGALLTLPAWTNKAAAFCPAGEYQFTDGIAPNRREVTVDIEDVAYVDIGSDGDMETVAILVCYIGQFGEFQVVAFDRVGSGTIDTVGTVVMGKLMQDPDGIGIVNMDEVKADGNAVAVRVGDSIVCCGGDVNRIHWQWRSYAFSGGTFTQVSGEREFPRDR